MCIMLQNNSNKKQQRFFMEIYSQQNLNSNQYTCTGTQVCYTPVNQGGMTEKDGDVSARPATPSRETAAKGEKESQSNIGFTNIFVEKYMSHAVCKLTKHHVMIISCYDFDVANKT